jgi:hypothetical protein
MTTPGTGPTELDDPDDEADDTEDEAAQDQPGPIEPQAIPSDAPGG